MCRELVFRLPYHRKPIGPVINELDNCIHRLQLDSITWDFCYPYRASFKFYLEECGFVIVITPFSCCCSTQLMDAGTGNVTAEPWRFRPSGLQNSCRSIRRELKLPASLDRIRMFPSQPRILLQREVRVRNLSCCLVTGHLVVIGKNHK